MTDLERVRKFAARRARSRGTSVLTDLQWLRRRRAWCLGVLSIMFVCVMSMLYSPFPFQITDNIALACGLFFLALALAALFLIVAWRTEKLFSIFVETAIQDTDEFVRHFSEEEKFGTAKDSLLAKKIKFIVDAQRKHWDTTMGVYRAIQRSETQLGAMMFFMSLILFLSSVGGIVHAASTGWQSSEWYSIRWSVGWWIFQIFFTVPCGTVFLVKLLRGRRMCRLIESTAIQNADELLAYLEEKEKH